MSFEFVDIGDLLDLEEETESDPPPKAGTIIESTESGIECNGCGWSIEGKGYRIDCCPRCQPKLRTAQEHKIIVPVDYGLVRAFNVFVGEHFYFFLDNGDKIWYNSRNVRTYYNATRQFANEI